jgi:hypothetical protein
MPRYIGLFNYSAEGNKGFLKDKAAGREAATRQAVVQEPSTASEADFSLVLPRRR